MIEQTVRSMSVNPALRNVETLFQYFIYYYITESLILDIKLYNFTASNVNHNPTCTIDNTQAMFPLFCQSLYIECIFEKSSRISELEIHVNWIKPNETVLK